MDVVVPTLQIKKPRPGASHLKPRAAMMRHHCPGHRPFLSLHMLPFTGLEGLYEAQEEKTPDNVPTGKTLLPLMRLFSTGQKLWLEDSGRQSR